MPRVENKLAETLSGLGLDYSFTEQSRRDRKRGLAKHAVQAGDRVPDPVLWGANRPNSRLYELLRRGGYGFLVFATATALGADRDILARLLPRRRRAIRERRIALVVIDEGVPDIIGLEAPILSTSGVTSSVNSARSTAVSFSRDRTASSLFVVRASKSDRSLRRSNLGRASPPPRRLTIKRSGTLLYVTPWTQTRPRGPLRPPSSY